MLLTCPLTRSEGFYIELFGLQNNSRNVVLSSSKVLVFIPLRERELVSLSLGFCQITCDNEHQCYQVVAEWKETFVLIHLCSIPPFSVFWCVRIQNCLTS